MDNLTASVGVKINTSAEKVRPLATIPYGPQISRTFPFGFGSGATQVNQMYDGQIDIAAGAKLSLNLQNASLNNWIGETIGMSELKVVWVENKSTTNSIAIRTTVTTGSNPLFETPGSGVVLPPGSGFLFATSNATGVAMVNAAAGHFDIENLSLGSVTTVAFVFLGN